MPAPLSGMNPYLENPELWLEVHHRLITAIAIAIGPSIRPKYRVAIEKRTYLSDGDSLLVGIPDVAVLSQRSNLETISTTTLPAQGESVTITLPMPEELEKVI